MKHMKLAAEKPDVVIVLSCFITDKMPLTNEVGHFDVVNQYIGYPRSLWHRLNSLHQE